MNFADEVRSCAKVLRALAANSLDRTARIALMKFPLATRKSALAMFHPNEPKPQLTTIAWRLESGKLLPTAGEPLCLPRWDGDMPPGGKGGAIEWSETGSGGYREEINQKFSNQTPSGGRLDELLDEELAP